MLRTDVEGLRIKRREDDRSGPLEALLEVLRGLTDRILRPDIDKAALIRGAVQPRHIAAIAARVEHFRVGGVGCDVATLASAHRIERSAARVAGNADRSVILLRAAYLIGYMPGGDCVIELRGGEGLRRPGAAGGHGDIPAAVVGIDHALGVVRRDPEIVMVRMGRAQLLESAAAVSGAHQIEVRNVDRIGRGRVGIDAQKVERPLPDLPVAVDQRPRCAGIVGPKQPAVFRFHQRVDALGIRPRYRHADLAEQAAGQSGIARDLFPRIAAIGGLE